jgi:DNA-binding NtrC family response regulator
VEQLRILLVDDEEDFASTLAERLTLRGFQAQVATSGMDALERVEEEDFNVLILDVKMPGIDGIKVMAQVKRKRPELPVILLSGHGAIANTKTKDRAFDCLIKPIDIDELIEAIRNAVDSQKGQLP